MIHLICYNVLTADKYISKGEYIMGYVDWNDNGRLNSIDTATELRMLEEVQKRDGTYSEGFTCYNLMAAAAVVGVFLSILSFL